MSEAIQSVAAEPVHAASSGALSPPRVRKPPLPGLTGVRTFLALGIMLFHFTPGNLGWLRPVIEGGFTYVSFFLLISGFILAYNYGDRIEPLLKRNFYLARLARLYPVYMLSLVVSLYMLYQEWIVQTRGDFFLGLLLTPFLLQGWSPQLATFWNTVAWTLSTEAALYLAFPFIIGWKGWPKNTGKLVGLFCLFWFAEMVLPTLYLLLNPDGLGEIDRYTYGYWLRALKYTPLPYVPIFLAGVTLGKIHGAAGLSDRIRMWMAVGAASVVLCVFYTGLTRLPFVILHGGLMTPFFATLILGLSGRHWIASVMTFRPIAKLGEASFCLYLLHFNTWNTLHVFHVPERLHVQAFDPWFSYVVILCVAYLAFRFVETPSRRYLLAKWVHRTPHPMEPVGPAESAR